MNPDHNMLTSEAETPALADSCAQGSLLPPAAELMRVRLRKAELARLFGVSKAAVTSWVKLGWVTVEIDGRIDPQRAARSLLTRADTSRMRSRFIAGALEEVNTLRRAGDTARREAAEARAELESLRRSVADTEALAEALAKRLAGAEQYGEQAAGRLFALAEAIRGNLAAVEAGCAPAAAALAAALRQVEGAGE